MKEADAYVAEDAHATCRLNCLVFSLYVSIIGVKINK